MRWGSNMQRRWRILKACVVAEWQADMAYIGNRISGAIAPLVYVGSFLIFIGVLYDNVKTIGGYNHNEMLFLIFIGQVAFYSLNFWGTMANDNMHKMVNNGNLDFLLLRPVNSLFLVMIHKIKVFSFVVNICGPLLPVAILTNWASLHLELANVLVGIPIIVMGVYITQSIQFVLTIPVFWTGRAYESHLLIYAAGSQTIPLEGMPSWFRVIFTGLFPVFIASSVSASVMLGKGDPAFLLLLTTGITIVMAGVKRLVWRMALKQYASASS